MAESEFIPGRPFKKRRYYHGTPLNKLMVQFFKSRRFRRWRLLQILFWPDKAPVIRRFSVRVTSANVSTCLLAQHLSK